MYIVIHCMGLPFNGATILKESLGGSETAAYYMAKNLADQGHKVIMFTNIQPDQEGNWDGVKYVSAGAPSEATPLGERFHFYAQSTPHDVLIIQRVPSAFQYPWAAKVKLWWVHDLAQMRNKSAVHANLWNMDGILTVSEMHKQQYIEVYGINPDIIYPIQNGIDLSLFEGEVNDDRGVMNIFEPSVDDPILTKLLYSSRPERGLEHLVCPNGIMEKLAAIDSKFHLYVCAYENTTADTEQYYQYLADRCEELENVTVLGSLTKQELADVMRQCDALVYPTPGPQQPDFEEVSCITAMEAMAAGLPFISSKCGALEETCKGSGAMLLDLVDGLPDINKFVTVIRDIDKIAKGDDLVNKQLLAAIKYDWAESAFMLLEHVNTCINRNRSNGAIARQLLQDSDIYALDKFVHNTNNTNTTDAIRGAVGGELEECYQFAFQNKWEEHYAKYYQYEEDRGVDYGAENLEGNSRFEHVSGIISCLPAGAVVLDYGCAHGHYTINLAKRFPDKGFIGVDITASNVEKANKWCKEEGLENVRFIHGSIPQGISKDPESGTIEVLTTDKGCDGSDTGRQPEQEIPLVDCIIAAEVIEHIGNPAYYVETLCKYLKDDSSQMIITTPFGPWEAQGYVEHHPWRAHVHHFDRADLSDLWGHMPNYNVAVAPCGQSVWGSQLGSYITTFERGTDEPRGLIRYDRKFALAVPRQTVTLCIIVKDAEDSIKRCLDSMKDIVDEVIIAIDETTTDRTLEVIHQWVEDIKGNWPVIRVIDIPSPMEIGFDEARNLSIRDASCDWIFWLDSDEVLINPQNIFKYLQNNCFDGYAIKQHHFTVEPLGVMKTDLPCRLFRNHKGVKFFGVVHEHPEVKLNEGVGFVQLIPDIEIAHHGYTTEAIRRNRFDRNINLLVRDREKYPTRQLGKFLWIRDLSQMCRYELEINGGHVTKDMRERALTGITIWEELLADGQLRMLIDGMEFYSMLAQIIGSTFEMGFVLGASKMNGGVHLENENPIKSHFVSEKHAQDLFLALFKDKVKDYGSKYF